MLSRKTLETLTESAAASNELTLADEWEITEEVERAAEAFHTDVCHVIPMWARSHQHALDCEVDTFIDDLTCPHGQFLILMTLRGEGVGIWDGELNHLFKHTRPYGYSRNQTIEGLGDVLKAVLSYHVDDCGSGAMNDAFQNAAWDQARE